MSLTNCRFYEEKFPEVDSYVMVNVKQVRLLRDRVWIFCLKKSFLLMLFFTLVDRRNGRIREAA